MSTWCSCPGAEGELGILPHHTPLVSLLGVGELKIRKGGEEESFAIAGGFLQVRPDKVVVMAETADLGVRDRPRDAPRRRGARRSGRSSPATSRAPTWPPRAPSSSRPCSGSASRSAGTARAPGAAPRSMADARPFHWEFTPEVPPPEAFRIEGGRPLRGTVHVSGAKNAALKLLAAATPDRRALPVRERARDRGRPRHGRGPRATSAWSSTTRPTACTRSRRATSTGCSSRSRPPPRCAPRSSCSGRSWRASGG